MISYLSLKIRLLFCHPDNDILLYEILDRADHRSWLERSSNVDNERNLWIAASGRKLTHFCANQFIKWCSSEVELVLFLAQAKLVSSLQACLDPKLTRSWKNLACCLLSAFLNEACWASQVISLGVNNWEPKWRPGPSSPSLWQFPLWVIPAPWHSVKTL